MWARQKVPWSFFKFLPWLYCSLCVQNLWPGGLRALKVRVFVWKKDARLQNEIILYCFKTVHFEYFLIHPRIF